MVILIQNQVTASDGQMTSKSKVPGQKSGCSSRVEELWARNGKKVLLRIQMEWSLPVLSSLESKGGSEHVLIQQKTPKYCGPVWNTHKGITRLKATVQAAATVAWGGYSGFVHTPPNMQTPCCQAAHILEGRGKGESLKRRSTSAITAVSQFSPAVWGGILWNQKEQPLAPTRTAAVPKNVKRSLLSPLIHANN